MYSFRQRSDTTVVDEPIYAHYLRISGKSHPGREEILASQSSDGEQVIQDIVLGNYKTPVVFFKQMCHHLVDLDWAFLDLCQNILLIRDPRYVLESHSKNLSNIGVADIGLDIQIKILESILASGNDPIVLEASTLLQNPEKLLRKVCHQLGISFDKAMLSWPSGPKDEDGVWAKHWYQKTHLSTKFNTQNSKTYPLPYELEAVLAEAQPLYERLSDFALTLS
tara:strand:- start:156 stop:824 length:669 start_codon:yes stop_codon:yes gene_type:complete